MRSVIAFFGFFLLAAFSSAAPHLGTLAQEHSYTSAKFNFVVDFPSPTWRLIDEPDDIHQHTEFIYGDRIEGYLRIRREVIKEGGTIDDVVSNDQSPRFQPGYVDGKSEPFTGRLKGTTASYEFTQAGKPMTGRTYYLQADSQTVFVLRFTGLRDKLARIRNQTDMIARSFRMK